MGNVSGCICRYGWCIRPDNSNNCKENHTSTPRFKTHRRNLSAAFNIAEQAKEFNVELLNINTATEEELMTLPGVNRVTAHGIVDYRAKIGAFKRIEDLALVIGATKFGHLRQEICVGKAKSSQNSSINDLSLQDNVSRSSNKSQFNKGNAQLFYAKVNINSSNVFQLMKVKGISQQLAENTVAYRDKKGPFRKLDELLKVKGFKQPFLSAIRPQLVLNDDELSYRTEPSANGIVITSHNNDSYSAPDSNSQGVTSNNFVGTNSLLGSQEDLVSMYGPIARRSMRSKKAPIFFKKNEQQILRLGSWNLSQCNEEKTENPGVREVIAMTILENGFSIVAIQELKDKSALNKICDELNNPTIPNIKKWTGHHGHWKCATSDAVHGNNSGSTEYGGFLYDASRGISLQSLTVLSKSSSNSKHLDYKPAVAVFKVNEDWEVVCVNIRMCPIKLENEKDSLLCSTMNDIMGAIDDFMPGEKDMLLLGDFGATPEDDAYSYLRENNYQNVLTSDNYTNTSTRNPEGTMCSENIWLGPQIQRLFTDTKEVVRDGLTSPWIPDGWGWGGVVSPYCPIYAEFFVPGNLSADNNANSLEAIKLTIPMAGAGDS